MFGSGGSDRSTAAASLWQFPENGDAGERRVAELGEQPGTDRQEDVDARSESNDAHSIALFHRVAELAVGDDPSRDQTRNLSNQNAILASFDTDGHLLVLETRLFRSGVEELALVVVDVANDAVDRITIDVNVEHVHEDRESHRAPLDEGRLVDLSDHDQLSIGRGHCQRCAALTSALGVAEEICDP